MITYISLFVFLKIVDVVHDKSMSLGQGLVYVVVGGFCVNLLMVDGVLSDASWT